MSEWKVNGTDVETLVEENRMFTEMELVWETDKETVKNVLRPAVEGSGSFSQIPRADGGFDIEDRSGGRAVVTLEPRSGRTDIRPITEWYVEEYEEKPSDTDGENWKFELVVIPAKEKAYDNSFGTATDPGESASGQQWLFEFKQGTIASKRIQKDVDRNPEGEITALELTMILFKYETQIIEESASKLNAFNKREVPDGVDLIQDKNADSANTVTITPPQVARDTVVPGDYVVTEWETEWNRTTYILTLSAELESEITP